MNTSELTKRVWLHLLHQGGWWTTDEVTDALRERRADVSAALKVLSNGPACARIHKAASCMEYAVLPDCPVLNGMTVGEVQL